MNTILKVSTISLSAFLVAVFISHVSPASAQAPIRLACGESIESVFTDDGQVHSYSVSAEIGMKIILYTEANIGNYEVLTIDTGLWAPNGFQIDRLEYYDASATRTIETDWLSVDGIYSISVIGRTNTGGAYILAIACIYDDGTVVSNTNLVQNASCGSIMENRISRDGEIHRYYLFLNRDDEIKFTTSSIVGNYETLTIDTGLWAPNGFQIDRLEYYDASATRIIETEALSNSGVYKVAVQGRTSTQGNYELAVTCTLADGTIVNPGDTPPISLVDDPTIVAPDVEFSGFGFPGLAPVDFTNVARLPIPAGIPMSGAVTPTGSEILGYQFDAEAGDTVELSFNRLSGNLNLGLVVIDSESNVIYQASLVTTQSMTVRFTVPTAGQYTAGIFRISLLPPSAPEPTAFQVIATVNP